jgi:crotonobetainyl-CoA:carnitine CoA-transferase CaiB-like acyl-CoA transferase
VTAPLSGLVVADLSRVLAGPTATVLLADLGATVVKVERAGSGDDTRRWGPPWTETSSSYFESANRSKQSLAVDFSDPGDLALVHDLVDRADIVVQNFRAGSLAGFGLDYPAVAARNPRAVYCSITGFGSGEGADRPGYDFLVQAVGGLMSITGDPDGTPRKVGVALVDVLTAKDAVIGILAALAHRAATGQGQHVEVNLLSSLLGSLANQASAYLATGTSPGRMGNRHPSIAPYETLRCRDLELAVCCGNDDQFRRLAAVIGDPALAEDPRFATNADRVAQRDELVARLEARLGQDDAAAWSQRLAAAGVPAGPVGDIGSAFALAEALGLAPTVEVGDGHPAQVRHPITYSGFEVVAPTPPPRLGHHDQHVRAWLDDPGESRWPG